MAEEARRLPGTSEEDPLLGSAGDASQQEGKPLYHNFFLGTPVRVRVIKSVSDGRCRDRYRCAGRHLDSKLFHYSYSSKITR